MNKILLIIQREYFSRVSKKSFIVMTILGPLFFAALMFGAIAVTLSDTTEYDVLIVDPIGIITQMDPATGKLVPRYPDQFADQDKLRFSFSKDLQSPEAFKEGFYNVMVELDDVSISDGRCNMFFKKYPPTYVQSEIRSGLQESLERFRVTDSLKLDYETYKRVRVEVSFHEINIERLGEEDRTQEKATIGFGFAIAIYFFIFFYGVQVMRGVLEEKMNRIVEVIVSSVKPFQLMMGKVIGIGLVGLTQFLIWVIFSAIVFSVGMSFFSSEIASGAAVVDNAELIQAGAVDRAVLTQQLMENEAIGWLFQINWPMMIGLFVFFFIGGYMIYGSLFAAIGAALDAETDTQQFLLPITLPLVFAYIVSATMIGNPSSSIGSFFAVFPLTSPVTMMVKAIIGASPWLIILSMVVLVITIFFFVWLAGRIYRVGILMYGKKVSYRELWKWIRY
ncbi:MAG: ABC transporter permease [Flavobacteriales bacterium]|jgi:ABC-2 type transport system permease protein